MKVSRRARRMQRHYGRMHKAGGLNLISLMDIFTILVFFLMVDCSDVKVLQQNKSLKLPESSAKLNPKETMILTLAGDDVLIQGRKVASLKDISDESDIIAGISEELKYQASRNKHLSPVDPLGGHSITIMGDKNVPYNTLKKVMNSCVDANYINISLAVSRIAKQSEG